MMHHITNPYIRNLFFSVDDVPTNPLVHIFLYVTLAFGVSFLFFADPTGASSSILYTATNTAFGGIALNLWGAAAIVASTVNTIAYMVRQKWVGQTACYMGWGVWTFAFIIYIMAGSWFGALVMALPNLLFWTWQFILVGRYHKAYHNGVIPKAKHNTLARIWKNEYARTTDQELDEGTKDQG